MTKGDAGMKRPGRGIGRNYKYRIKKVRSRIEKISGWGWMHIYIFLSTYCCCQKEIESPERANRELRKSLDWDSARVC